MHNNRPKMNELPAYGNLEIIKLALYELNKTSLYIGSSASVYGSATAEKTKNVYSFKRKSDKQPIIYYEPIEISVVNMAAKNDKDFSKLINSMISQNGYLILPIKADKNYATLFIDTNNNQPGSKDENGVQQLQWNIYLINSAYESTSSSHDSVKIQDMIRKALGTNGLNCRHDLISLHKQSNNDFVNSGRLHVRVLTTILDCMGSQMELPEIRKILRMPAVSWTLDNDDKIKVVDEALGLSQDSRYQDPSFHQTLSKKIAAIEIPQEQGLLLDEYKRAAHLSAATDSNFKHRRVSTIQLVTKLSLDILSRTDDAHSLLRVAMIYVAWFETIKDEKSVLRELLEEKLVAFFQCKTAYDYLTNGGTERLGVYVNKVNDFFFDQLYLMASNIKNKALKIKQFNQLYFALTDCFQKINQLDETVGNTIFSRKTTVQQNKVELMRWVEALACEFDPRYVFAIEYKMQIQHEVFVNHFSDMYAKAKKPDTIDYDKDIIKHADKDKNSRTAIVAQRLGLIK